MSRSSRRPPSLLAVKRRIGKVARECAKIEADLNRLIAELPAPSLEGWTGS